MTMTNVDRGSTRQLAEAIAEVLTANIEDAVQRHAGRSATALPDEGWSNARYAAAVHRVVGLCRSSQDVGDYFVSTSRVLAAIKGEEA